LGEDFETGLGEDVDCVYGFWYGCFGGGVGKGVVQGVWLGCGRGGWGVEGYGDGVFGGVAGGGGFCWFGLLDAKVSGFCGAWWGF